MDVREPTVPDVKSLQRCINDLVSILALPGMWTVDEPTRIVDTLLGALVQMLQLDLAYARLRDRVGEAPMQMVRVARSRRVMPAAEDIGAAFDDGWANYPQQRPRRVRNPIGDGDISIVAVPLGLQGEIGVIVAGSERADFPAPTERLLLGVAANQAAIGLQEARLLSEQQRIATELDQRVAQRTEELAAANEELRRITDAIAQMILVQSPEGLPLYTNRVAREYTGVSIEEVGAENWFARVLHPEDLERVREELQAGMTRPVPFRIELRARGRDGRYRWTLGHYNPLLDDEGKIVRWYATGTDIDERKHAEDRTRKENLALREEISGSSMFEDIVGSSAALKQVISKITKVAPTDSTVLITGETGTGKELVARAIHAKSKRAGRAFIPVNCAAIPQELIASELFGHEKGAFTGALQRRIGRFESADGGTIFLDEVGDLPMETQVALLRVLQEREIERIGSSHPIQVDVRVLTATNRDLEAAVAAGKFREDLFYRLNVFPVAVPALRERKDDVRLLVEYMLERSAKKAGKKITRIDRATLDLFEAYGWPGNVRELQNVIERAVILCEGDTLSVDPSWFGASLRGTRDTNGAGVAERERIEAALMASKGRVAGPFGAANKLGIPRQTLDSRIAALGIDKYQFRR